MGGGGGNRINCSENGKKGKGEGGIFFSGCSRKSVLFLLVDWGRKKKGRNRISLSPFGRGEVLMFLFFCGRVRGRVAGFEKKKSEITSIFCHGRRDKKESNLGKIGINCGGDLLRKGASGAKSGKVLFWGNRGGGGKEPSASQSGKGKVHAGAEHLLLLSL